MTRTEARRRVLKALAARGDSRTFKDSDCLPICLYTSDQRYVFCHAIAGKQWGALYEKLTSNFCFKYNPGPFDPLGFIPHGRSPSHRNKPYATVGDLVEAVRAAYPL